MLLATAWLKSLITGKKWLSKVSQKQLKAVTHVMQIHCPLFDNMHLYIVLINRVLAIS